MNQLRVLLVDEDSGKSEAISSVLAGANHIVLPANGLDEAGEALMVEQFDAVLLTSRFSARSLAEFTAKIRRVEQNQRGVTRIPVLALESTNGNGSNADTECDAYLHEPLDPAALTSAVKSLAQALSRPVERKTMVPADSLPVLEPEKFEEQVGFDNDLMVEIIDLFLEERKRQVVEMRESVEVCDWGALSRAAHTIKGSLGSLHATRSRARAQELEFAARDGVGDVCITTFSELVRDLEALEPMLLELKEVVTSA